MEPELLSSSNLSSAFDRTIDLDRRAQRLLLHYTDKLLQKFDGPESVHSFFWRSLDLAPSGFGGDTSNTQAMRSNNQDVKSVETFLSFYCSFLLGRVALDTIRTD